MSPAKLALADGLDPAGDGFELRVHGVGGSSAEQLLEQSETVQVGGDQTALFVRRWGSRRRAVPWPLEGYWWGGLTSRPTARALWVFFLPLMLCNLASWMLPAPGPTKGRWGQRGTAAAFLPPVMRWAGYALTLLLAASLATASMDVFGWQCAMAPAKPPAGGHGGPVSCMPGWLGWTPTAPGPRLVFFALVPVLVLALIGYACRRTLRSYERWRLPAKSLTDQQEQSSWPLTADGFWAGLRPVRRQQLLHLAGAGALLSLYLAMVPGSHPGVRAVAVTAACVLLALPVVTLAFPQAGRSGVNPHSARMSDLDITRFDWWCGTLLGLSLVVLAALLVGRIWWQPAVPASPPGLLPGDSGIWWGLTLAMAGLVVAAAVLTAMARNPEELKVDRPFAAGFLAPLTLGLSCVSGGIFAGGLNLLLPHLLIGAEFRNTAPAISGLPSTAYPLVLPVPTYGFMFALLAMAAITVILILIAAVWFFFRARKISQTKYLRKFYDLEDQHLKRAWRQRWRIAFSWTKARLPDYLGTAMTALTLAGIIGAAVFDVFAPQPSATYWVTIAADTGQWLALAAVVALFGYTRQAFTDGGKRRQIGVLWDVGTFWPRASQPLAPPCYMERSVPETVNRLRRALGGTRRDGPHGRTDPAVDPAEEDYIDKVLRPELGAAADRILLRQDWVLINGYSQGSPIAAAIIAQLPQDLRDKVSLVTVGCPLRRLYGRAFPAYFGQRCLLELASKLTPAPDGKARGLIKDIETNKERLLPVARWRNLVRPSDYIGSYVFDDLFARTGQERHIDKLLQDPPRIIPADATTPPPIHEHSDFWPDPQAAVIIKDLVERWGVWPERS
jgi:hypothetical protein